MFKGFRTIVADDIKFINSDEASLYMKKNLDSIRDGMFNFFYDNYGKILDGSLMSDKLFPLGDYDIFLSHSGIDIDIVNKLAYAFRACLETHLSIMKRFNSMLAMAI